MLGWHFKLSLTRPPTDISAAGGVCFLSREEMQLQVLTRCWLMSELQLKVAAAYLQISFEFIDKRGKFWPPGSVDLQSLRWYLSIHLSNWATQQRRCLWSHCTVRSSRQPADSPSGGFGLSSKTHQSVLVESNHQQVPGQFKWLHRHCAHEQQSVPPTTPSYLWQISTLLSHPGVFRYRCKFQLLITFLICVPLLWAVYFNVDMM